MCYEGGGKVMLGVVLAERRVCRRNLVMISLKFLAM